MPSIINLEKRIEHLKNNHKESYKILSQIYSFYFGNGMLIIPKSFENKVLEYFGHRNQEGHITETVEQVIGRIQNQKILKTFNHWTGEGALFNSIRTDRPGMSRQNIKKERNELNKLIESSAKNCDFCQPEKYTPEDVFGRVKGKHSITASNIAKYDSWSGLVVFKRHDPLTFNLSELSDYLDTAFNWFEEVYHETEQYKFPFFVWNCLHKAGASQVHGHAQVLMTQQIPYAKIKSLLWVREKYSKSTGRDYLKDVLEVHQSLGLAHEIGDIGIFATLTPIKEKEIVIISPLPPSDSNEVKNVIYNTLRCFIDMLGVHSFNFSISSPPMDDKYESPYIMHLVDRGSLFKPTADIGGMELFGSTVVGDDPFKVIQALKSYL